MFPLQILLVFSTTPVDISPGTLPSGGWVSSIGVNPEDGNEVIMTLSNYEVISVWYTADGGASWENISGNLEENADGTGDGPSVRWGIILPHASQKNYLVATSVGVYSTSVLNGTSTVWALEGQNSIGNVVVDALVGRPSDGIVVAGTSEGVFTRLLFLIQELTLLHRLSKPCPQLMMSLV